MKNNLFAPSQEQTERIGNFFRVMGDPTRLKILTVLLNGKMCVMHISQAVGMSQNTVKKRVDGLRKRGLISTEHTTVTTKNGRVHNGSLLYTLLPITPDEEAYFQKMIQLQSARKSIQKGLKKDEKQKEKPKQKGGKNEAIPA